jgi:hypothetical protein
MTLYGIVVAVICAVIPAAVYALFAVGGFLGVQWYVSAVSILLMGRFIMGVLEH